MILLSNDDGIAAPGLRRLYRALRTATGAPVLVVAPTVQHSGQGHAITLDRSLTATPVLEEGFFGFAVDGTPADCVKLAVQALCPVPPTLVVCGINDGPNVGRSLFYSGTVGAALEAAIEGQAALAVSADHGLEDLDAAAAAAAALASACVGRRELRGLVLNLNFPAGPATAWRELHVVDHGLGGFTETYRPRLSGGRLAWHLHGERGGQAVGPLNDARALADGHPTLTVLEPDLNPGRETLGERLLTKARQAVRPTLAAATG